MRLGLPIFRYKCFGDDVMVYCKTVEAEVIFDTCKGQMAWGRDLGLQTAR